MVARSCELHATWILPTATALQCPKKSKISTTAMPVRPPGKARQPNSAAGQNAVGTEHRGDKIMVRSRRFKDRNQMKARSICLWLALASGGFSATPPKPAAVPEQK